VIRRLGLLALLAATSVFTSTAPRSEAAGVLKARYVAFPFKYSGLGKGRSFWFHVPRAAWGVEARTSRRGCGMPSPRRVELLEVTSTKDYPVVIFDNSGGNGGNLGNSLGSTGWSGWSAHLVRGIYRDKGVQMKPDCRWWIRFTRE